MQQKCFRKLDFIFALHNQRRIYNPVEHLRWSFKLRVINYFFIADVRLGSKYAASMF